MIGCGGVTGSSSGPSTSSSSSGPSATGSSSGAASGASSVTLAWTPPTQNTDGTTLTNLAGYKVHYGTAPQQYTDSLALSNPGLAAYVMQSLPSGTYYFAMSALNADGIESGLSSEATAVVN